MSDENPSTSRKMKAVYFNGKLVGEIPAEADAAQDLLAGQKLIKI